MVIFLTRSNSLQACKVDVYLTSENTPLEKRNRERDFSIVFLCHETVPDFRWGLAINVINDLLGC